MWRTAWLLLWWRLKADRKREKEFNQQNCDRFGSRFSDWLDNADVHCKKKEIKRIFFFGEGYCWAKSDDLRIKISRNEYIGDKYLEKASGRPSTGSILTCQDINKNINLFRKLYCVVLKSMLAFSFPMVMAVANGMHITHTHTKSCECHSIYVYIIPQPTKLSMHLLKWKWMKFLTNIDTHSWATKYHRRGDELHTHIYTHTPPLNDETNRFYRHFD